MAEDVSEKPAAGGMSIEAWEAFRVRAAALEQAVRYVGLRRPGLFAAEQEREVLRMAEVFARYLAAGTPAAQAPDG